jgi:pimeloyl-ACP methyl ester carboxylesterase
MTEDERVVAAVTGGPLPAHARVRTRGLSLHCLVWGEAGAPVVLAVHGNGGHAHWWDALVPHLLPAYRVVAPDLRGHGESDWPTPPAYAIRDFSDDLLAIVDQLAAPPVAVIAHSMGARAAAWFAAHHADRVRCLALLDTSIAGVDAETAARWRGKLVGQRQGPGYPDAAAARAAFRFVPPETDVDAAIVADLAHHAVYQRGPDDWSFRFDRAVLSLQGDGAGDLTELVAALRCPLWIGRGSGSRDVIPRSSFDPLLARRTDLALHDFPGAHHFFLSHPDAAGRALRGFIDQAAAASPPRPDGATVDQEMRRTN